MSGDNSEGQKKAQKRFKQSKLADLWTSLTKKKRRNDESDGTNAGPSTAASNSSVADALISATQPLATSPNASTANLAAPAIPPAPAPNLPAPAPNLPAPAPNLPAPAPNLPAPAPNLPAPAPNLPAPAPNLPAPAPNLPAPAPNLPAPAPNLPAPAPNLPAPAPNLPASAPNPMDISNFTSKKLSDAERILLIDGCWKPSDKRVFDQETSGRHKGRKFNYSWLGRFGWLRFSGAKNGCFCIVCVLFLGERGTGKGKHQAPKLLITEAYNAWKDAIADFEEHEKTDYHKECEGKYRNFRTAITNDSSVDLQLNEHRKLQQKEEKIYIGKVVDVLKLCCRQNFALRGHDESDAIDDYDSTKNPGNFRAIIRHQMTVDSALSGFIAKAKRNAVYLSPRIQNELINLCANCVTETIAKMVEKAEYFSVLADEGTDVSNEEQLTVLVRFVSFDTKGKAEIQERFLEFSKINSLTGEALAQEILDILRKVGLDPRFMVGQGYDGASNMSGKNKGTQAIISQKYPLAKYTHCGSHSLNLVCVHACGLPVFKNTMVQLQQIIFFFTYSPQRENVLKEKIRALDHLGNSRKNQLVNFCETRWVDRNISIIRFLEMIQAVILALDELSVSSNSAETRTKANAYSATITQFSFLMNLVILEKVSTLMKDISVSLQSKQVDLVKCVDSLQKIRDILASYLDGNCFDSLFRKAQNIAAAMDPLDDNPAKLPRQCKNTNLTPEELYRKCPNRNVWGMVARPEMLICQDIKIGRFEIRSCMRRRKR